MRFCCGIVLVLMTLLPTDGLRAQETGTGTAADTVPRYVLEPLVVEGRGDDLTGVAMSASQGFVGFGDFKLRPLVREGELLETVPGLIMTQHSGDGKSNQMFVRGFNLDHGTDFSTSVEGMPVNIPTHAHGQGYTDLNFIIPELVDHVEYRLGPYYAGIGDFGSAGGAELRLRRSLERPFALTGIGEDGYRRAVAAASVELGPGRLLAGGELKGYDGPWTTPQELRKRSGVARYSWESGSSAFSVLAMAYDNAWNASDQVPSRRVEGGEIGRFDQIDPSLGGSSSRYALTGSWSRSGAEASHRVQLYGMRYDLDLYSNFTYFLEDPTAGDQIQQRDRARRVFGGQYTYTRALGRQVAGRHVATAGVQTRLDLADVALRRTEARQIQATVRADEVAQWGTGAYVELRSDWTPELRTVLGVRSDAYRFVVSSDRPENSGEATDAIVSPKASVVYALREGAELYVSGGYGFHSNDARGTVQAVDPVSGEPVDPVHPLAESRGAEVGLRAASRTGLHTTLTAWTVALDSELLFVGDAGTTEPSDASRRVGVTWANFWRPAPQLRVDLDASFARARFSGAPEGADRVPGALERVVTGGIAWEPTRDGPYAALRLRHFGAYPLTEDNAIRASATSLLNLNLGWTLGELRLGASLMNLLDAADADIAYFYRSRLPDEPTDGIEDLHFHPVEPRQLRVTLSWGY
ncbi:MAG: TonB-dependent receptor plug domain-containing protein [Longimicrobiales bacterium]